ncbi:MAG: metallophosphoesterase [Myxococcales bacterium]|nr:MAG: metallophosphoesterase [Myxococcales bacterium]
MSGRTIIVGDVHGCSAELEALLKQCAFEQGSDEVIFVGDLVGKGPDPVGVVALARDIKAKMVLGNHDWHVLRVRDALDHGKPSLHASHSQHLAARNLSVEAIAWLKTQPLFLKLPEHNAIVVHAGLRQGLPLEKQDRIEMITMRSVLSEGRISKKITNDCEPWAKLWSGPEHVVFGHDAIRGLQQYPFATGLDTGCVYGGKLTALLFPERKLISVDAQEIYLQRGKREAKY